MNAPFNADPPSEAAPPGRPVAGILTWRYVLALSLIALLTITGQVLVQYSLNRQREDSRIINVAGRQRMLSRALWDNALAIMLASDTDRREQAADKLREHLTAFEQAHQGLVHGSAAMGLSEPASPDLLRLYADLEPLRREMMSAGKHLLAGLEKGLDQDRLSKESAAIFKAEEFVTLMDRIVTQYERDAAHKINNMKTLELTLSGVVLIVLLLEALFIFRPAVNRIRTNMADLQKAAEKMRRLSLRDGLTGVANRRYFDEYLLQEWQRALRNRTSLALIMMDVDHFKRYNDTHGHLEGDRVLIEVARAARRTLQRPTDLVARYGGEEFVVILPDTGTNGARHVAQAIQQAVLDLKIPHGDSPVSPYVTISLGVAGLTLVPPASAPSFLVEAADQALYRAKEEGRNTYRLADLDSKDNPGG